MTEQPIKLERSKQEARASQALDPNVVAVIDAGEDQGRPYIGSRTSWGNLKQRIARSRPHHTEALAYGLEVPGLGVAHEGNMSSGRQAPERPDRLHRPAS
jgi:hypothetical protein